MATDFTAVSGRYVEQHGFARRDELLATGVTRSALASAGAAGRWERPFRGVHGVGDAGPDAELWSARAMLGPESVVVLASAARLHGIEGVAAPTVPSFALPPGLEKQQRPGVHLHFWAIPETDRTENRGLPVTTVARTLADLVRSVPRMQAVACVDSALHQELVDISDLEAIAGLMRRKRNCVSGRRLLGEARTGAQSPLETRVRLRASDGGFPPDGLQVPILNAHGTVLGYADMGYRLPDGSWLVVEADGRSVHELPEALLHDRRRQNAFLADARAQIIRFTWEDSAHPAYIPGILRAVLGPAGWRPSPLRRP